MLSLLVSTPVVILVLVVVVVLADESLDPPHVQRSQRAGVDESQFWQAYKEAFHCPTKFPFNKHAADQLSIDPANPLPPTVFRRWRSELGTDEALAMNVEHVVNNGIADLIPKVGTRPRIVVPTYL